MKTPVIETKVQGLAHCPICTRTVPAEVLVKGRQARVADGQKCPRCHSSLNVAVVVGVPQAA